MTYMTASCATPKQRRSLLTSLTEGFALRRQRNALKRLDDRALKDIGISRAQAEREAARPAWDAPSNWLR